MLFYLFYVIGFALSVYGGTQLVLFTNLIAAGLSWQDFFEFVKAKPECYLFPIGLFFICLSLFFYPPKTYKDGDA